jgi:hypothetical protein
MLTLDVMESKDKKAELENPGGDKIMAELGGKESGLPFFAFVDEKGKRLANSNAMPGEKNIGCPATPEEIDAFEKLLKQVAPKMKPDQLAKITETFRKNAPKQ